MGSQRQAGQDTPILPTHQLATTYHYQRPKETQNTKKKIQKQKQSKASVYSGPRWPHWNHKSNFFDSKARWWCKKRKFENYRFFNVDFPPVNISRSKCAHCISDVGLTDFLSSDVVWIHRMAGERWELLPLLGVDLILMCVTVAAFICHMCEPVEPSSALPRGTLALPIPKLVDDEKHKYIFRSWLTRRREFFPLLVALLLMRQHLLENTPLSQSVMIHCFIWLPLT